MWTLYYDGGCNLCHASKLRAEGWAQRRGQILHVKVLQSDEAIQKGYGGDAMVLEADRVYVGHDAWIKLTEIAPWHLRWIAVVARIPIFRWLIKQVYTLVARFRYRWFGTRSCQLPQSQNRH